ncbi:hypothetical protein BDV11DRAFT_215778 [Aspergillus similis]
MSLDIPEGTPDRGQPIVILAIFLIAITTLITAIRILSKFVAHQNWWWDDLFAVLALLFEVTLLSIVLAGRNVGLGYHAATVAAINPQHLTTGAQYFYVTIFLFGGSVCFPKLSAVLFYARVFGTNNRTFTIHLWIAGALTAAWLLSAWISTLLECRPMAKVWSPTLPGTCIDVYTWFLITAILSSTIDMYILLLPVPLIWGLRASLRRRITVLITFFMAYSVIVLSICRIVAVVRTVPAMAVDFTWELPLHLYWALLEISISIISISVPSCLALVKAIRRRYRTTSHGSSSRDSIFPSGRKQSSTKNSGTPTRSGNERDRLSRIIAEAEGSIPSGAGAGDIPLRRIVVQTDIRVDSR